MQSYATGPLLTCREGELVRVQMLAIEQGNGREEADVLFDPCCVGNDPRRVMGFALAGELGFPDFVAVAFVQGHDGGFV